MTRSPKVLIAAGAVGTVAVVGFAMQWGSNPASPTATAMRVDTAPMLSADDARPGALRMDIDAITLTSSMDEGETPRPSAVSQPVDDTVPAAPTFQTAPQVAEDTDCPLSMTAEPSVAGLVSIAVHAPCAPYARVRVEHEGIAFSELTDSAGHLDIAVPALAEQAAFVATLDSGTEAYATAQITSVAFYDRAVVQAAARDGVFLHALEFGAGYGDAGHVWLDAPRDPVIAARGQGGFLITLGDPTLPDAEVVQVYSYPTGTSLAGGDIHLSVEAEVTEDNCTHHVRAALVQVHGGLRIRDHDLDMTMPDCDAVGDYILLKTAFEDLTIASR